MPNGNLGERSAIYIYTFLKRQGCYLLLLFCMSDGNFIMGCRVCGNTQIQPAAETPTPRIYLLNSGQVQSAFIVIIWINYKQWKLSERPLAAVGWGGKKTKQRTFSPNLCFYTYFWFLFSPAATWRRIFNPPAVFFLRNIILNSKTRQHFLSTDYHLSQHLMCLPWIFHAWRQLNCSECTGYLHPEASVR